MNNNQFCGEVITSSLNHVTVVAWHYDKPLPHGRLIAIPSQQTTVYAFVAAVQTSSDDASYKPFAYKLTKEELQHQQPQIFHCLQTTMQCLIVGFMHHGTIYHMIASEPPEIHSFVRSATAEELQLFVAKPTYLQVLFGAGNLVNSMDELLLAIMREMLANNVLQQELVNDFVTTFSLLTGNDYRRLKLLLQRVQQFSGTMHGATLLPINDLIQSSK